MTSQATPTKTSVDDNFMLPVAQVENLRDVLDLSFSDVSHLVPEEILITHLPKLNSESASKSTTLI